MEAKVSARYDEVVDVLIHLYLAKYNAHTHTLNKQKMLREVVQIISCVRVHNSFIAAMKYNPLTMYCVCVCLQCAWFCANCVNYVCAHCI